jgi:peptide/nickel transport system permease protein
MKALAALSNVARALTVLLLSTFMITVLVRLLPGDPVDTLMPFATDEGRNQLREELGLNLNVVEYYLRWLGDFVRGDFGQWYASTGDGGGVPIGQMLGLALPRSLLLMLYTMVFSLAFALPLGIFLGYRADSRVDRVISNATFALSSVPSFALGLSLVFVFGLKLNLLPVLGYVSFAESPSEHFKSMLMPVVSLSIGLIAGFSRLLRVDTIATLREDFVTMASSKGLSNAWILWRHVLRPSSTTLMTSAALQMGGLIGGAVVIEIIFALNGFGMLLNTAIATRQYLAIQSLVALIAVAFIVFNLIVNVLYAIVDPRVRSARV